MMQTSVFTMEQIAAAVKPLADKYRVKEIYLFGSYARGEADENSDLDFLVFAKLVFGILATSADFFLLCVLECFSMI